jgi:hypothetical protein
LPTATTERVLALQLLARYPNGCTEALMLGHGFTVAFLAYRRLSYLMATTAGAFCTVATRSADSATICSTSATIARRTFGISILAACRTDVFVVRQPLWFGRSMLTWEA